MKKGICKSITIISLLFLLIISTNVSFEKIFSLPENFIVSYDEIKESNLSKKFGSLVSVGLEKKIQNTAKGEAEKDYIVFKLFGFIPVKKVAIELAPEEEVYLGGVPIGISITANGAIVVEENLVLTSVGEVSTQKTEKFKKGDIIYQINGKEIKTLDDIEVVVNNADENNFEVDFLRQNKKMRAVIKGVYNNENKLKLGLLVKDDVTGIGTLTYVNTKTNKFGALGHAITDQENIIKVFDGKIYDCNLLGIQKGERNNPGQLRCVFLQSSGSKGEIQKNNKYGVFGEIEDKSSIIDENLTAKIGGRLSVNPGKAKIVSSISGIREEYEIEIIKANYQSVADDKSIVFRVTDDRLLKLTGGIVQGMSGSPIIQNNKVVGAVTHVFISDPTKGYGVYSDWMVLNE